MTMLSTICSSLYLHLPPIIIDPYSLLIGIVYILLSFPIHYYY